MKLQLTKNGYNRNLGQFFSPKILVDKWNNCDECEKRIKDKTTLAMNMKFHGRDVSKFLCKKCFKKLYEMDDDKWNKYVESFKRDGCALF